ncbi:MAG: carboxypeptidase regulatory-like domain-containing protein [candidate division NC10 bacterium]|nr:carboxypeptidase regulatory-like domain-containing protein [candidate division NC10 bacterium]MDE2322291.1 carboxypeptidase regulatory-like domain-containing protein [candidate division NC10 bacterium]
MFKPGWYTWWFGGVMSLVVALSLSFSVPTDAGLVSGRVNDTKGTFQPGGSFRVKDSSGKVVKDSVKTDESKGYSLFLPPGIYTVEFSDGRSAVIQSHPEPIRQDIHLK